MKIGMTIDAARVDICFFSLADLIRTAYRVKPYQVSGPSWIGADRFNIQAKIPDGVSKDVVPEMLQALLAERFQLTFHRENKEIAVDALVAGKIGPARFVRSKANLSMFGGEVALIALAYGLNMDRRRD